MKKILVSLALSLVMMVVCTTASFAAANSPINAPQITINTAITDTIHSTAVTVRSGYYKFRTSDAAGLTYYFNILPFEKEYPSSSYMSVGVRDSTYQFVKDIDNYYFDMKDVYGLNQMESRGYNLKPNSDYYLQLDAHGGWIKYQVVITQKAKIGTTKIKSVKTGKRKIKVSYTKSQYADNYQIQLKAGKGNWKTYSSKTQTITLKKLKKGKTYSIRVRGKRVLNGKKYYGSWSKVRKIKCN